ncbi:nuclear transport factor 2 family protein [Bradyrhizobium sp. SYSU BS000235]|uniref:nuclear transport factor 2 family protein n=1 Tax=Bradyrhizobium sp. SYSU BS000235 TaxID=3411332 RepID=UPI003C734C4F
MTDQQSKQCILDFLDAFYKGDAPRLEACCHDGFTSIIHAPVDVFPHLGLKEGKSWIAQAIRIQQERYSSRRYTLQSIIVDDDRAAALLQVNLTKRNDQRILQFAVADFFTLRDGLVLGHQSLFDSFDFLQQVLGRDLTSDFARSVKTAIEGK